MIILPGLITTVEYLKFKHVNSDKITYVIKHRAVTSIFNIYEYTPDRYYTEYIYIHEPS